MQVFSFFSGIGIFFEAEQGSEFITQLSLDWVDRLSKAEHHENLRIVQLVPGGDSIIEKKDIEDVVTLPGSKIIEIPDASMFDLKQFDSSQDFKYLLFCQACFGSIHDSKFNLKQTEKPSSIVFLVHGIRDYGEWINRLSHRVRQIDPKALVVSKGYGYFNLWNFLIPSLRRNRIAWFCSEYTKYVSLFPDVPIHFAGHSYGTYLIANAIRRFPILK